MASTKFHVGPRDINTLRWFIIIGVLALVILAIVLIIVTHYHNMKLKRSFGEEAVKKE